MDWLEEQLLSVSELERENKKLKLHLSNLSILIADLMFAYVNKDEDLPHSFEVSAFGEGYNFIKQFYIDDKYNIELFENVLKKMKNTLR